MGHFTPLTEEEVKALPVADLQRELDRTKTKVFLGQNSAFLGSIMSTMDFVWSYDVPTAATNGETFWWNPVFFLQLEPKTRETVLMHELWHAGLLHMVRRGERDPYIWNVACDIRINNGLENDGFSFVGVEDCCKDQQHGLKAEEDIYDELMKNQPKPKPMWGPGPCTPNGSGGQGQQQPMPGSQGQPANGQPDPNSQLPGNGMGDMVPTTPSSNAAAINRVVRAIHTAKLAGQPGSIPGGLEEIIEEFLKPVVPWETLLHRWMKDLLEEDYTWARPNRRFSDIYLPSRYQEDGRLEHLIFYQDTSGSMTDDELLRTNSEIKFIWDEMRPKKLTTVMFDTKIHKVDVFEEGDSYERIAINGRGGTCLKCVRNHILSEKPTAAVIFSDMYVAPMEPLPFEIPILWLTKSKGIKPPFGELIEIRERGGS